MAFYEPVTPYDEEFLRRFREHNMEAGDRLNDDPHPEAEKLVRDLGALDWCFYDDSLRLKFGGDGDNGEILIAMVSILMRLYEKETLTGG